MTAMFASLKYGLLDAFWLWMMHRHGTPMRSFLIVKFTRYWHRCRRSFVRNDEFSPAIRACAEKFEHDRLAVFRSEETARLSRDLCRKLREEEERGENHWSDTSKYQDAIAFAKFPEIEALLRGDMGDCFRAIYGCEFKVYFCSIIKKWRRHDEPKGSELWHTDSHPGTCVKAIVHLSDVTPECGATEFIPWPETVEIVHRVNKEWRRLAKEWDPRTGDERRRFRAAKSELFSRKVERGYRSRVEQPCHGSGTVVFFSTNTLHRGGFPEPGHERYTLLATAYPADSPPPFDRYREIGTAKRDNYPRDPAEVI